MVESACGLGCLVLGWFLGSSFLSPPSVFSSLPSTMTWAPCPHGVRTRGKKQTYSSSTFAHCSQLQQLCLPRMLRTIEREAFYKCTSLKEVSTPPSLLYIARHAFAGCTHLRTILKQGKSSTWRGTYAQSNAFDKCERFDKPTWLRVLPNDANDLWREDHLDPAPETSNASEAGEERGRRE